MYINFDNFNTISVKIDREEYITTIKTIYYTST